MDAAELTRLATDALILALTLAAPVLAATWLTSLATSALLSVTQLTDSTLVVVPRLVAGLVTLWFMVQWMGTRLTAFTGDVLRSLGGAT